tara:strand:- start:7310 stop:8749 length:1440 start_codon:yes stop_codon:yes gene_type:complete
VEIQEKESKWVKVLALAIDPFLIVSPTDLNFVRQKNQDISKSFARGLIGFISFAVLTVHVLYDYKRTNIHDWQILRAPLIVFGIIFTVTLSRIKNSKVIFTCLSGYAVLIAHTFVSQFSLGYPVRSIWISLLPSLLFSSFSRFFIFNIIVVACINLISYPEIKNFINPGFATSNFLLCVLILSICHIAKIQYFNASLEHRNRIEDMRKHIESMSAYNSFIESFFSKSLLKKINFNKGKKEKDLIRQFDDLFIRREIEASILHTDIRNFSARSTDTLFIENEVIPTTSKIIDQCDEMGGFSRQIGDSVFVVYDENDPKISLIKSLYNAFIGITDEWERVKNLGRHIPERDFVIGYGKVYFGNMASINHREITVLGDPPNICARIDKELSHKKIRTILESSPHIILSKSAYLATQKFSEFDIKKFSLSDHGIQMSSYKEETEIYFFEVNRQNIKKLNQLLLNLNIQPRSNFYEEPHYEQTA